MLSSGKKASEKHIEASFAKDADNDQNKEIKKNKVMDDEVLRMSQENLLKGLDRIQEICM